VQVAPLTLEYDLAISGSTNELMTADVIQAINISQRRSMRQGNELAIAGIRIVADKQLNVKVSTLPRTWVTAEAWKRAFRVWRELNKMALKEAGDSVVAKYNDFKVYMDSVHSEAARSPTATNYTILPVGHTAGIGSAQTAYNWEYSEIEFPEDSNYGGLGYKLHMVGPDDLVGVQSLGIIHHYALSRSRPLTIDANVPVSAGGGFGDSAFTQAFDFGNSMEDVVNNLVTENDEPPYPVGWDIDPTNSPTPEFYPGGANFLASVTLSGTVAEIPVYSSAGSALLGQGFIPGFVAPLGLIRFDVTNLEGSACLGTMFIDLVPGDKNGIMARSMMEMNS